MDMTNTQPHPQDHPNQKLERLGPEGLSDKELLALMLGGGRASGRTLEQAGKVLAALPTGLQGADKGSIVRDCGIGTRAAAAVAACLELGRRTSGRSDGRAVLDAPARVAAMVPAAVRSGRKEHFLAFYLNARSQLVHSETISIGTLSASLVHPRECFGPAIIHSAAAMVVCHNLCDASHKLCNVKSNIM